MGWIHAGTNGRVGRSFETSLTDEEKEQKTAQQCQKEAEYNHMRTERESNQDAEYQRILRVAVDVAKEGDFSNEPQEDPTDDENGELLSWFGSQQDGVAFLTQFLSDRGWNTLSDLWEIREALLVAKTAFLLG